MASGALTPGAIPAIERPASPVAAAAGARWDAAARGLTRGAFGVILVIAALAPVARTGDAHQYHAMAAALAAARPPSLTAAEVDAYKTWLQAQPAGSNFAEAARAVDQPPLMADGRQEFSHFWFYPLLAAPVILLTDAAALHPGYAFLLVNAGLLGLALWMVQRAYSPVVSLLLLASPVIWSINKAQVEVFTFSLLAIALARARQGHYLQAALAAAIASTQNMPILAAVACFWAAGLGRHVIQRQRLRITPAAAALVAATLIVGALHPLYYLWRLGVPTPQRLNGGINLGLPPLETYLAVLIDLDIGLLPWMPLFGVLAAFGLALLCWPGAAPPAPSGGGAAWPADLRLAALCGLVIGAWFLFVFAQTTNLNSGGTVHLSRYGLWLLPLGLPLLAAAAVWTRARAPALLPTAGLIALVAYAVYFHPAQGERYLTPSPQAAFITAWLPSLYRPVPEIFYERRQHTDGGVLGSAAAADCHVILLNAAAPDTACRLNPAETLQAEGLLAGGWQAVWIIRSGPFGPFEGRVFGAMRQP